MERLREPAVSGQFYPSSKDSLDSMISKLAGKIPEEKEDVLGIVAPHAGYIYSGRVAASVYSLINITDTVIMLGPNHTGSGMPFSIETKGSWNMPMGKVNIDAELALDIQKNSKYLKDDIEAGSYEHSLEVQVPFLQYFKKNFKIVPIVISFTDFNTLESIGDSIGEVLKKKNRNCLIIASSDMTHYESEESANKKDKLAIDNILKLDEKGLYDTIKQFDISMCGIAPTVSMLRAVKLLGARSSKLIKYETSGEASGDYSSVVGYAGVVIK